MPELANCEECGKLFVQTTTNICPSCRKELDEKFERVWQFIRQKKNRESTVYEVHEQTGVEEKLIFEWIREGRLLVKDFVNLTYPCRSCGKPIQSGALCAACQNQLKSEVKALQIEEKNQGLPRKRTYHTR